MTNKKNIFNEHTGYFIASQVTLMGDHANDPSPSAPVHEAHRDRREQAAAAHAQRMEALFGDLDDAPEKNTRTFFVRAHVAPAMKDQLEERLAKVVNPEAKSAFLQDPRHLIRALKSRVYQVEKAPRLLSFPEGGSGDHWDNLPREYDGWTYKERQFGPDGAVKSDQVVTCLRAEFADAHATRVGTVLHLLREGHVNWPKQKPATLAETFKKALNLATSLGREINAQEKSFNTSIAVIQRRAMG